MIVSGFVERGIRLPAFRQQAPLPTPAQLMDQQAAFIRGREAVFLTQAPLSEVQKALPETVEAAEELGDKYRPSRRQLRQSFPEEVGDTGIYLMSAALSLGITPHEMELGLQQRLEQNPVPKPPFTRRGKQRFHRENLDLLQARIATAKVHLESLENVGQRDNKATDQLLDALHQVWVIGKSAHPNFEQIIAQKIERNDSRFMPNEFRVREGENPHVRHAIAYARQKMRETWSLERAMQYLQDHEAIQQHNIAVDASLFANL